MKRIIRSRHLTPDEIEKDRQFGASIEKDKPAINPAIRKRMGKVRQAKAAASCTDTLGQRIRAAREARGLSQNGLAAAARMSKADLSQIEGDQLEPTLTIALRVARVLALSLDELAGGMPSGS